MNGVGNYISELTLGQFSRQVSIGFFQKKSTDRITALLLITELLHLTFDVNMRLLLCLDRSDLALEKLHLLHQLRDAVVVVVCDGVCGRQLRALRRLLLAAHAKSSTFCFKLRCQLHGSNRGIID